MQGIKRKSGLSKPVNANVTAAGDGRDCGLLKKKYEQQEGFISPKLVHTMSGEVVNTSPRNDRGL